MPFYFKFVQWVELAGVKISSQSGVPRPGPVWRCQGQSGVPGRIQWCQGQSGSARASLGCQGQSGVPGPVKVASASLVCQGQSGVPEPIWSPTASLDCQCQVCQGQSGVPGPAKPSVLHQGCNQVPCAARCAMLCCWIATGVR